MKAELKNGQLLLEAESVAERKEIEKWLRSPFMSVMLDRKIATPKTVHSGSHS